jgi:single-stranded DNA-binding protein
MASISIGGKVTCKEGAEAVTVREFGNGGKIAKFSVIDTEYFYSKDEDKKGQFYSVEVSGKGAEIVADRIQRGDRVTVHGQLVQREYNDKTYLDVKSARVTFLEGRRDTAPAGDSLF